MTFRGGKAQVWSVTTGKSSIRLRGCDEFDRPRRVQPGWETHRYSGRWTVQLWDAVTGKRVGGALECAPSDAEGGAPVIFSPDSTYFLISFLSASEDKFVRAWDCKTGEPLFCLLGARAARFGASGGSIDSSVHGRWMRIVTTCQDHACGCSVEIRKVLMASGMRKRNTDRAASASCAPQRRRNRKVRSES